MSGPGARLYASHRLQTGKISYEEKWPKRSGHLGPFQSLGGSASKFAQKIREQVKNWGRLPGEHNLWWGSKGIRGRQEKRVLPGGAHKKHRRSGLSMCGIAVNGVRKQYYWGRGDEHRGFSKDPAIAGRTKGADKVLGKIGSRRLAGKLVALGGLR